MRHIISRLFFLIFFLNSFSLHASTSSEVKDLIRQFEAGKFDVGVNVYSLGSNKEIFAYKADKTLNPASTAKILSSATAFNKLGPDFRFKTSFVTQNAATNGTIEHLYVIGGGDPQINEEKVESMANALYQKGIRVISGDIIIDQSFFDKKGFGESLGNSGTYRTPLTALVINYNRFGVVVSSASPKPVVKFDFPSDYFVLKSDVRLGKGSVSVTKKFENGHEIVLVKGALRSKKDQVIYREVSNPGLFAGYFFKSFFEKRGIKVLGHIREGNAPQSGFEIYTHESDNLVDIIKIMNKKSINFTAEMLTKYLGARFQGAPGTTAKGVQVIEDYLKSIGLTPDQFTIENGSGLSRLTHIAPKVLTKVLRDIRSHPTYNAQYLETLAVAGEDGTVSKRFRDSDLKGKAFLKTGTLNGVSSLSGYVILPTGDDIVFAILINGAGLNAWKAHEFQETLLDNLVHLNGVNATSAVNAY